MASYSRTCVEPLAHLQWDMSMIHATATGSYERQLGDQRVLVGVIDTGIQGSHPDIAPNFSYELSRNFTTDIPLIDGPCKDDPDGSCDDPRGVDESGHGTHVAGTIASPINGFGIAGVAPEVTLVNLRAGQDSGYFFLQASVDALTYAADNGIDVVNMSYYVDPWLYNCTDNPADSPEATQEQRTIRVAMQRALEYAHQHKVTLVSGAGNSWTDLGNPTFDDSSPDFPPGENYPREVDNSCLELPNEGRHVVSVSSLGPSGRKSWFSNWGTEQIMISAPGGDTWDEALPEPANAVLAPYPRIAILEEEKLFDIDLIDENGKPLDPSIIRQCRNGSCAYYSYLQGTSMASPHAVGVAALIISEDGRWDDGEIKLNPRATERALIRSANEHGCPPGGAQEYEDKLEEIVGPLTASCEGSRSFNGLYGYGIVDALEAVR
ncbi:hypothetical protein BH24ACT26_BH24ACT26_06230 [soil metagenome]